MCIFTKSAQGVRPHQIVTYHIVWIAAAADQQRDHLIDLLSSYLIAAIEFV
ncbi:hypothetical protein MRY88_25560 [Bacillus cereus]|nr:hypothetical protein [Bacillus cereus]QPR81000.1 hypothetical protein I6G75_15315 [Bacillus cereus]